MIRRESCCGGIQVGEEREGVGKEGEGAIGERGDDLADTWR